MDALEPLSAAPLLRSSLWWSTPVDCPPGSPPFINAVVGLMPLADETPESLLQRLHEIENRFGRLPRKVVNEPRSLDLDLIAFRKDTRTGGGLILPHPRAHLRKFVLAPLAELAPDLILPGQTKSVSALLDQLTTGELVRKFQ